MEQLIPQPKRTSEEEYLHLEEAAKDKHEFRGGEIIAMAGATGPHVRIATNLIAALAIRLRGTRCVPYGSDLRVRINESGSYCYPDVTVVCGPLEYAHPDRQTVITNPRVIIEVTSPSTESGDRGAKFSDYRNIDLLDEYLLVSQERPQVETFYRQPDGIWAIGPTVVGLASSVRFRCLEIEIPLSEIYDGVTLTPVPVKTE